MYFTLISKSDIEPLAKGLIHSITVFDSKNFINELNKLNPSKYGETHWISEVIPNQNIEKSGGNYLTTMLTIKAPKSLGYFDTWKWLYESGVTFYNNENTTSCHNVLMWASNRNLHSVVKYLLLQNKKYVSNNDIMSIITVAVNNNDIELFKVLVRNDFDIRVNQCMGLYIASARNMTKFVKYYVKCDILYRPTIIKSIEYTTQKGLTDMVITLKKLLKKQDRDYYINKKSANKTSQPTRIKVYTNWSTQQSRYD